MKLNRFLLLLLIFSLALVCCSCAKNEYSSSEFIMDTFVSLTAIGDRADEAVRAGFDEIRRIDALMNAHSADSEVYRLNNAGADNPVMLSEDTLYVLNKALDMSRKTDGAFDISIKPLADLWDIRAEEPRVPDSDSINEALSKTGYEDIIIDGNMVSFAKEGMGIDLGAAAKGYCADRVAEIFNEYGIKDALIDLGGNIYALGKNKNGGAWRIGIQTPDKARGEYFAVEELSDKTAVTSGSYERYFKKDGKVYHHIIDPHTGCPAESGLISVTVIGKSSLEADMLSTAVFVMGEDNFRKISDEFDFEKYIVADKDNRVRTYDKQN